MSLVRKGKNVEYKTSCLNSYFALTRYTLFFTNEALANQS